MLRKIFVTIMIVMFPIVASAQLKVGIMNPEEVMDSMPETVQIQGELEEFIQEKQQEFTEVYSQWMESITNYEERVEAGTLSGQEQEEEEQRLMEQEEQLENQERQIQNQIQIRQNELITPIMEEVENAMQAVAEELDLDYVINKQTSQGDPVVYYSSERGVDITGQVIDRITSN